MPSSSPPLSLRARLLAVALVALLPVVGGMWLARERALDAQVADREVTVHDLATLAAREHAEAIDQASGVLAVLGALLTDPVGVQRVCEDLLPAAFARAPYYTALAVYDSAGGQVCRHPDGPAYRLLEVPYFAAAVATGEPTAADYHVSPNDSLSRASLAWPVRGPAGRVSMIVVGGIDLAQVETLHRVTQDDRGLALLVVGTDGEVLLREPALPGTRGRPAPRDLVAAARTGRDTVLTTTDLEGVVRTFAMTPMTSRDYPLGAAVAVGFDRASLAADLAPGAVAALSALAVGALVLFAGIWIVLEVGLLQRLGPVVATARRLGAGDGSARTGLSGSDEVGTLAQAFDAMADRLEEARAAEHQASRRALEARDERFRLLAETIDEVFWIYDLSERRLTYISPAFETLWKSDRSGVEGSEEGWIGTVHPDDREAVRTRALTGKTHEFRIVRPDGEVRWVRNRSYPVPNPEGRPTRFAGVLQDITEQRGLEDALLQTSKLEAVGRLAGGVAHDFNNILTAVRGHLRLLLDDLPPDADVRPDLEEIDRASLRAERLTRQLLAFGRKQPLDVSTFDLAEQVRDTASLLQRLVGEDIAVSLDLSPTTPCVRMDRSHLEQILVNLTVNARDAMPGGGRLTIRSTAVRLPEMDPSVAGTLPTGAYARLEVEDDGRGMDADTLHHAFEPFFTTKATGKGTGLGLATVYGVTTQAGGHIRVASRPGRGTRFTIYLPATDGPATALAPDDADPQGTALPPSRILVVEDEEAVRRVAVRTLRAHGHDVLEADDGSTALEILRNESVDLVLSDMVMPSMGGRALAEAMRRESIGVRLVFMSGYPGTGADDPTFNRVPLLQKPFTRPELLDALARATPVA